MNKCKFGLLLVLLLCGINVFSTVKPDFIKIVAVPEKQRVDITIGGEPFTSLLYADSLKKPVLFPIYTSKQNMITRGWPIMPKPMDRTDYAHQIGLWFSYSNVNGVDYWNTSKEVDTTKKILGNIRFQKVLNITNGEGKGSLTILSKWFGPGAKVILEEISVFTFKVEKGLRIIDRQITLKALVDANFKDSKDGLYALRAATELGQPVTSLESAMLGDKGVVAASDSIPLTGRFFSSEGKQGEAVFAKRAKWMKLTGRVNSEQVTLVMMDHPQNINYPAYWLARSYGIMSANPFGAEIFTNGKEKLNYTLPKGKQVSFKYRFVQGGRFIDDDTMDKLFSDFTNNIL